MVCWICHADTAAGDDAYDLCALCVDLYCVYPVHRKPRCIVCLAQGSVLRVGGRQSAVCKDWHDCRKGWRNFLFFNVYVRAAYALVPLLGRDVVGIIRRKVRDNMPVPHRKRPLLFPRLVDTGEYAGPRPWLDIVMFNYGLGRPFDAATDEQPVADRRQLARDRRYEQRQKQRHHRK
jgi:hypothetical protein